MMELESQVYQQEEFIRQQEKQISAIEEEKSSLTTRVNAP